MLISDDSVVRLMRWSICGSRCWFFAQNELLKACTRPCFDNQFLFETSLFGVCRFASVVFFLFYFAMKSHPVELWAEFHQFEPFRIVSSVFSCCIARDSRTAFFSSSCCSAFGAFECDNDANAFAFGHNNSVHFWE